ncbi:MAG: DNA gyrase/topoisomerase IV subunit A [Jatrophihabitans sp.]|uniref:DNA gyrase/topoisomerase IV subunit A n=1 Tax=Jatrophihabitans sp. TaxID=1932789 RepID=UPI003F7DDF8D
MARRESTKQTINLAAFDTPGARVIDTPLHEEVQKSYGEYGYSVITARGLPDARDGLKPSQRRIMFAMAQMGLRPERGYVKSSRVVGEVMGKFHPHGDASIYDTMVRMAQDFQQNTPLIDGHGAWGTLDDGAAASRYTECRLSPVATLLVDGTDEETVDFRPTYDGSGVEPVVLPAAFPNLLVNGADGIAVGMSTNMIPHNLGEVIAATRWLVKHPNATLDKLMSFVPGPDLPTGGILLGLDAVRSAYETGRGVVRIRARVEIGPLAGSRGRQAITITEFPYGIGPVKVIEAIQKQTGEKRLQGIADVKTLTDMTTDGERMVIECKAGVNPQALLADLYRLTPMEVSFGINNNVLVNGKPQVLGLKQLLEVFLDHRFEVVTRRTRYRLRRAEERRHLVEGMLIALDNIDQVVRIIRASLDTAEAKTRLVAELAGVRVRLGGRQVTRSLDEVQAAHILDMPLRRLVNLEVETLRTEWASLTELIAQLQAILDSDDLLRTVVSDELAAVAKDHASPRLTTLLDGDLKQVLAASVPAGPLEVADDPCQVVLSATGLVARTAAASEEVTETGRRRSARTKHDVIAATVEATARGQVLLLTNHGRAVKTDVLTLPTLPEHAGVLSLRGGVSGTEIASGLRPGERVIGLAPLAVPDTAIGLALGTKHGQVKVTRPEWPVRSDVFDVIGLADGDEVVGTTWLSGPADMVFVSSDGQVLRFDAAKVRPQGLSGGGMAGINLAAGAHVVWFGAVRTDDTAHGEPQVVVSSGDQVKVTPLSEYPAKGRATGGVATLRYLAGQSTTIAVGWAGTRPIGCTRTGDPVTLPDPDPRRGGSGVTMTGPALLGHQIERE